MPTILTVDDFSSMRGLVGRVVRDLGCEVAEAENGFQALVLLEEQRFDLILLDVSMPEMDGPAMLRVLRERGDHTPVILVTSECQRGTIVGAMKLGIADYILKPFQPQVLRTKVARVLRLDAPPACPHLAMAAAVPAVQAVPAAQPAQA
ncbi:MAG TPA: response regulator, partial [Kofleriaceae bacterium]|nr:response regulator [Kofleriaceae bacterium]